MYNQHDQHHSQRLLEFAEGVATQTLGTVIGAGVLYVLASWLGMVSPPSPQTVGIIVVAATVPLIVVLVPRRRRRVHSRAEPDQTMERS